MHIHIDNPHLGMPCGLYDCLHTCTCTMYVSYGSGSEVEEKVMSVMRERIPLAASQPLTDTL